MIPCLGYECRVGKFYRHLSRVADPSVDFNYSLAVNRIVPSSNWLVNRRLVAGWDDPCQAKCWAEVAIQIVLLKVKLSFGFDDQFAKPMRSLVARVNRQSFQAPATCID